MAANDDKEVNDEYKSKVTLAHGYAVYRYQAFTRLKSVEAEKCDGFLADVGTEETEDDNITQEEDNTDHIQEEVVKLSLLSSNLHAEKETTLRSVLTTKVQYGSVAQGSGNILPQSPGQLYEEPCMVYFNLLRSGESKKEDDRSEDAEEEKLFVVSFLVVTKAGLDLFHPELDSYCLSLTPYLDKYMESVDVSDYLNLIESWYSKNICFISRCLTVLKDCLGPLLYHTFKGDSINLLSLPDSEKEDIERLIGCCSLMYFVEDKSSTSQGTSEDATAECTFVITSDGLFYNASSDRSTPFCNDCVMALKKVKDDDPFTLRQILENYKIKVIQDMNTFKRLTKQAESDFYALYRALAFLINCNNGEILLHNAKMESRIEGNANMKNVLRVLEDYIVVKGGFKVLELSDPDKAKMQYMIKILGH